MKQGTPMGSSPRKQAGLVLAAAILAGSADGVSAQRLRSSVDGDVHPSAVREELEEVDSKLRRGKWRAALAHTEKLTETVLGRMWYGRELKDIVTDLAVHHALAEANLGRREAAIWHWHIAQNLDVRVRRRDLAPYGKAGKLLYEFPLRPLGEVPAGFEVPYHYPGGPPYEGPVRPEMRRVPKVVNNGGAVQEGSGDFSVEVIIDERGEVHQPVVISSHLHPIVIYASLEWLRGLPAFRPARFEGEPADALEKITVRFQISRW